MSFEGPVVKENIYAANSNTPSIGNRRKAGLQGSSMAQSNFLQGLNTPNAREFEEGATQKKTEPEKELERIATIRNNFGPGIAISAYLRSRFYNKPSQQSSSLIKVDSLADAWMKASVDERITRIKGISAVVGNSTDLVKIIDDISGELADGPTKQVWEMMSIAPGDPLESVKTDIKDVVNQISSHGSHFVGSGSFILDSLLGGLWESRKARRLQPFLLAVSHLGASILHDLSDRWDEAVQDQLGDIAPGTKAWRQGLNRLAGEVVENFTDEAIVLTRKPMDAWDALAMQYPDEAKLVKRVIVKAIEESSGTMPDTGESPNAEFDGYSEIILQSTVSLFKSGKMRHAIFRDAWREMDETLQYKFRIDWLGIVDCAVGRVSKKGVNIYLASHSAALEFAESLKDSKGFARSWANLSDEARGRCVFKMSSQILKAMRDIKLGLP